MLRTELSIFPQKEKVVEYRIKSWRKFQNNESCIPLQAFKYNLSGRRNTEWPRGWRKSVDMRLEQAIAYLNHTLGEKQNYKDLLPAVPVTITQQPTHDSTSNTATSAQSVTSNNTANVKTCLTTIQLAMHGRCSLWRNPEGSRGYWDY